MTERGTRHHAQSQHADTADPDQMYAQIEEGRFEIRRADRNQPQSGKQIAGKQNPQHRFFQYGFIPPAVHLYGKITPAANAKAADSQGITPCAISMAVSMGSHSEACATHFGLGICGTFNRLDVKTK